MWTEQNQAALVWELDALRQRLSGETESGTPRPEMTAGAAAIDVLTKIFDLSVFERDLLLLCAGVEMDSALAEQCATLQGRPQRSFVTFSLAMSVLSEPHWSALAPTAPLRRFRLIETESGQGFTSAPLHIDERVLHFIAGFNDLDRRLEGVLRRKETPRWMADEHRRLAAGAVGVEGELLPLGALHLLGDDALGQEGVAALIAERAGCHLYVLPMENTPATGTEMDQFLSLWAREAALLPALLLLQWESETVTPAAKQLAERIPGTLFIASREGLQIHRTMRTLEVNKAGPAGQKLLWEFAMGGERPGVDQVAEEFHLSAETIGAIAQTCREPDAPRLWAECRAVARPQLESLAERIVPSAHWDDLILPEMQMLMLRQLAAQSRNRMRVHQEWGFAATSQRGLGLSALFSGPSGTGKTMAAEVLAADLQLDLYRIDLSAVVSKYIGETEKNLRKVFDAAETGGVLLLFDEADAIFGKRAEVKDSHDRYANIEVGYLLQRMESFQGLAVLTTNIKSSLDKAFQRRLRFLIDFPFPDATQRAAIWARAFPAKTPTERLLPERLANLHMPGGNIRNIAMNAAFLAAEEGTAVTMSHVLQATGLEAAKVERPIADVEIRGWV